MDKRQAQADGEYITRILKRMWNWRSKKTTSIDKVAMEMILREELPSMVMPNKTGEWLFKEVTEDYHVTGQCSKCKERRRIDNYCSNCGSYNGD